MIRKILFFSWLIFATVAFTQEEISNYHQFTAYGELNGKPFLILRKFNKSGQGSYLAVDMNSLETKILKENELIIKSSSWPEIRQQFADLPYTRALTYAANESFSLQDAGITHGYPKEKGITLTIDLCPSTKPLDRSIFTTLISEFAKFEQPVPLALSISGRFLLTHTEDIDWLKDLQAKGQIDITWINHSYNHHYDPNAPLEENFLLKPGTDLNFEVLGTEIAMLEHGLLPSVFFRFPGLVSDNSIADKIITFGLIPIGSDAWLAKGQISSAGSIVLIHGNGNEPIGVEDFINLLRTEKENILDKQWLLFDLRDSVSSEFEGNDN